MEKLEIPTNSRQVTEEWIKNALGVEKVLNLENVKEKSGYLSNTFRVKIEVDNEVKSIFIKIILDSDDELFVYFERNNFDQVEIRFYKEYLPKLIEFEKKFMKSELENEFVPEFLRGDFCLDFKNRGYYLILEDISEKYEMNQSPEGFNFAQINGLLLKIAHFHALAFAYNQKCERWKLNSLQEKLLKEDHFIEHMESSFVVLLEDLQDDIDLHHKGQFSNSKRTLYLKF